ncbi:MAG: hypothetical protein JO249_23955 [Acidobacteria bacterium]|nr:hypothetical protein [Acidobacteriota bacterium]
MLPKFFILVAIAWLSGHAVAQQTSPPPPQVKVNVLNVCTPSAEEQKEIAAALSKVPKQPVFTPDFEVARGRSTLSGGDLFRAGANNNTAGEPVSAAWVRMRRDFSSTSVFSNVQYSFSKDAKQMIETLVLHVRDPRELAQLSVEDEASAVTSAAAMLSNSTPVSRIRLERFGKPSVVLARCTGTPGEPMADQSAYEPLFRDASLVMSRYRTLLEAPRTVPDELAKLGSATFPTRAKKPVREKAQR